MSSASSGDRTRRRIKSNSRRRSARTATSTAPLRFACSSGEFNERFLSLLWETYESRKYCKEVPADHETYEIHLENAWSLSFVESHLLSSVVLKCFGLP